MLQPGHLTNAFDYNGKAPPLFGAGAGGTILHKLCVWSGLWSIDLICPTQTEKEF